MKQVKCMTEFEKLLAMARDGENLDSLVHHESEDIRATVASHGRPQDLDILVHDKSDDVLFEVAVFNRPQDNLILTENGFFERLSEEEKEQLEYMRASQLTFEDLDTLKETELTNE